MRVVMPLIRPRERPPSLEWWNVGAAVAGSLILGSAWRWSFGTGWWSWLIFTVLLAYGVMAWCVIEIDFTREMTL